MTNRFDEQPQTLGEEVANSLSHGLGLLRAVASLPILVAFAAELGGAASATCARCCGRDGDVGRVHRLSGSSCTDGPASPSQA